MTDIYRRPSSGEPFRPSARQQRMLLDAAERIPAAHPSPRDVPAGRHRLVLVHNGTGSDFTAARPICRVVFSVTTSMIRPQDRASVVHEIPIVQAASPTATGQDTWCILTGPLKNGSARLGIISGVSFVRLQVDDEELAKWARPITNDRDKLLAVDGAFPVERPGVAQILWREGGTGVQDALVRLPCLVQHATLWKLDPATGELLWHADRGSNSQWLVAKYDGSDVHLWECGAESPRETAVTKWVDQTLRAEWVWEHNRTGGVNSRIALSESDSVLWLTNGVNQDIRRIDDTDGTQINAANVTNPSFEIEPDGAGGLFVYSSTAATLRLLNTSIAVTATVSSLFGRPCRLPTGWFVCTSGSPKLLREYDDSLTLLHSQSAVVTGSNTIQAVQLQSSDDKVLCIELASGAASKWQLIDVPGLAADWTITQKKNDGLPGALTGDGDVYVVAIDPSANDAAIYRLAGADGSVVWTSAFGASGSGIGGFLYSMVRWDDLLIVVARSAGRGLTIGGTIVVALALDAATGDVVWARSREAGNLGNLSGPHIANDFLYVSGARTARGRFADVVAP